MTHKPPVKLSANENCYGCSYHAKEAILRHFPEVHLYPQANPVALKEKIGDMFDVPVGNVVTGAGSVAIIDALIKTLVGQNDEVLTFEKSFIAYTQLSAHHKVKCCLAPLADFRCLPANLIPFINNKTKLIFIANPNNPTGTIITHQQVHEFLTQIPSSVTVVLDEAYSEYVTDPLFPDSLGLQKQFPNLVILHSFSKIYGLAGLRIGFGLMEASLAAKVTAAQVPFSLNYLSYQAASAALDDQEFIQLSSVTNAAEASKLVNGLKKAGFNTIPTQANFVYVWFDTDAEKDKIWETLSANGIIVCDMKIFGQDKSLRITVGDVEVNKRIIALLKDIKLLISNLQAT